jgi:hypothetical protein
MGGVFNYVNLHVYHYAGNNPINLTDPNGRTLEFDGGVIKCDLTSIDEMEKASSAFNMIDPVNGGYAYNKVIASDGQGLSVEFNNRQALSDFMTSGLDYDALRETLDFIGTELALGAELTKDITPELSKSLGILGSGVSFVSFGMTAARAKDNLNVDTVSDVVISGIGTFGGLKGTMIAIGLSTGKLAIKGTIKTAESFAILNRTLKKDPMSILRSTFNYMVRY